MQSHELNTVHYPITTNGITQYAKSVRVSVNNEIWMKFIVKFIVPQPTRRTCGVILDIDNNVTNGVHNFSVTVPAI